NGRVDKAHAAPEHEKLALRLRRVLFVLAGRAFQDSHAIRDARRPAAQHADQRPHCSEQEHRCDGKLDDACDIGDVGLCHARGSTTTGIGFQPTCLPKKASVFSLNAATFSYKGACEQSSKIYSSEFLMPFFSRSANRVEVTLSWRPKVICVGARTLPSCASASCSMTALDAWMNASSGCLGRPRTNSERACT